MYLYICIATVDNKRKKSVMKNIAAIDAENIGHLNSLKMCPVCGDLRIQLINLSKTEKF